MTEFDKILIEKAKQLSRFENHLNRRLKHTADTALQTM